MTFCNILSLSFVLDFAGVCLCIFIFTFFTVPGCLPSRVRFSCLDVCLHVCLPVSPLLRRWAKWRWTGRSKRCVSQCSARWSRRRWMPWTCPCPAASACGATATCVPSRKAARRKRRREASWWATGGPIHPRATPPLSEPSRAAQVGGNMGTHTSSCTYEHVWTCIIHSPLWIYLSA